MQKPIAFQGWFWRKYALYYAVVIPLAVAAIILAATSCGSGYNYPPGSGPSCQLQCAPSPAPARGSVILDSTCDPATDTQQATDTQGQTVQCDSGLAQDPTDNGPTWETP